MTILVTDPRFLEHRTEGHPECPERLTAIVGALAIPRVEPREATIEELERVHTREHVEHMRDFGAGWVDADTYLTPRTYEIARLAAGALLTAVEHVAAGRAPNAFCAVRPPGHHATPDRAMGFCIFNNVAVAARHLQASTPWKRVMIVDFDVHHGNGTQDIFLRDRSILYLSTHRFPFYPGTGAASQDNCVNLPFDGGTPRAEFLKSYETAVRKAAKEFRPDFILVSAGFDAYRLDPIGGLGLEIEDYRALMEVVADVAPGKRVISALEGGYNLDALGACAKAHFEPLV